MSKFFPYVTEKYFPCVSKFFPVSKQNSLCFPCLEKVRTKFPVFPVFPVPWPPWQSIKSRWYGRFLCRLVENGGIITRQPRLQPLTGRIRGKTRRQKLRSSALFFLPSPPIHSTCCRRKLPPSILFCP